MSQKLIILRYILLGLVTATFLGYGVMILMGKMTNHFLAWGFPSWSVYGIGGIEVLSAGGLHWKKMKGWSMVILTVMSMGAILTLVGHHAKWIKDPVVSPIPPILLLLCLFGIMYLNGKKADSERTK